MRISRLVVIALMTVPTVASARDIAGCAALYRQLNNAPKIIGDTQQARQHAMAISRINAEIRNLRIEMRRSGCGGGSIVVIGRQADKDCQPMRQAIEDLERERGMVTRQRDEARRNDRSSLEKTSLLSEIRRQACTPSDMEEDRKISAKIQGIALPPEESTFPASVNTPLRKSLSTTPGRSKTEETVAPLPGPERPYIQERPVRMVGPIFLPEQSLDLKNPRSQGPQATEE